MKNIREFLLAVVMVFFAISSLLGSSAQSSLDSAGKNDLYNRNGWDALQEDINTRSVLGSLCEGLENNSTACYEYTQKQKSIGNYNSELLEKIEEYSKGHDEDYKKYKNHAKWSKLFFWFGMISFFIYFCVASFSQKK